MSEKHLADSTLLRKTKAELVSLLREQEALSEELLEKVTQLAIKVTSTPAEFEKTAHWIYEDEVDCEGNRECSCSSCGFEDAHRPDMVNRVPYCWHCGAKMDMEETED